MELMHEREDGADCQLPIESLKCLSTTGSSTILKSSFQSGSVREEFASKVELSSLNRNGAHSEGPLKRAVHSSSRHNRHIARQSNLAKGGRLEERCGQQVGGI